MDTFEKISHLKPCYFWNCIQSLLVSFCLVTSTAVTADEVAVIPAEVSAPEPESDLKDPIGFLTACANLVLNAEGTNVFVRPSQSPSFSVLSADIALRELGLQERLERAGELEEEIWRTQIYSPKMGLLKTWGTALYGGVITPAPILKFRAETAFAQKEMEILGKLKTISARMSEISRLATELSAGAVPEEVAVPSEMEIAHWFENRALESLEDVLKIETKSATPELLKRRERILSYLSSFTRDYLHYLKGPRNLATLNPARIPFLEEAASIGLRQVQAWAVSEFGLALDVSLAKSLVATLLMQKRPIATRLKHLSWLRRQFPNLGDAIVVQRVVVGLAQIALYGVAQFQEVAERMHELLAIRGGGKRKSRQIERVSTEQLVILTQWSFEFKKSAKEILQDLVAAGSAYVGISPRSEEPDPKEVDTFLVMLLSDYLAEEKRSQIKNDKVQEVQTWAVREFGATLEHSRAKDLAKILLAKRFNVEVLTELRQQVNEEVFDLSSIVLDKLATASEVVERMAEFQKHEKIRSLDDLFIHYRMQPLPDVNKHLLFSLTRLSFEYGKSVTSVVNDLFNIFDLEANYPAVITHYEKFVLRALEALRNLYFVELEEKRMSANPAVEGINLEQAKPRPHVTIQIQVEEDKLGDVNSASALLPNTHHWIGQIFRRLEPVCSYQPVDLYASYLIVVSLQLGLPPAAVRDYVGDLVILEKADAQERKREIFPYSAGEWIYFAFIGKQMGVSAQQMHSFIVGTERVRGTAISATRVGTIVKAALSHQRALLAEASSSAEEAAAFAAIHWAEYQYLPYFVSQLPASRLIASSVGEEEIPLVPEDSRGLPIP